VTTVGQEAIQSFGELSGKKSSQPIDGSSYSPDGEKILFSGEDRSFLRNDAVEIYTIGVHGKNRVQLTENATNDYYP
jgi:Tol biopolymer transport system component